MFDLGLSRSDVAASSSAGLVLFASASRTAAPPLPIVAREPDIGRLLNTYASLGRFALVFFGFA